MQIIRSRPWEVPRGVTSAAAAARAPQARVTAPRRRPAMSPLLHASANSGGSDNATSTSSSSTSPPPSSSDAAASRALRLVDEAMEFLHRELFVSEAIARATGEEPEDEGSVVARVVEALAKGEKSSESQGFKGSFEQQGDKLLGLSSPSSSSSSSSQNQSRELDEAFLVALGVAAAAATSPPPDEGEEKGGDGNENKKDEDPKAQEIVRRLRLLRDATLARASASLPAELRALDAASRAGTAEERRAVVREALLGGGGGGKKSEEKKGRDASPPSPSPPPLKRVSPAAFYSASCQVIDDMEERQIVPDAALLARVVLCRDDALALQRGSGVGDGNGNGGDSGNNESAFAGSPSEDADLRDAVSSHGAMLHRGGAEFAAMLVSHCKTSEERKELVKKVMRRGDVLAWQGSARDESSVPSLKKARAAPRPGRLLAAIYAARDALAARGDSEREKALERARRDAVAVMEEIGYS